jgi:hypothetical protein
MEEKPSYYERNKDKKLEYAKKYREDNKNSIKEYQKKRREENKEYFDSYYEKNKEKLNEKAKEKINCLCGAVISRRYMSTHSKTNKHILRVQCHIEK